jgi:hypothetical protein
VLASFYSSGAATRGEARRRGGRRVDQRRWRFNLDDFHEGEHKEGGETAKCRFDEGKWRGDAAACLHGAWRRWPKIAWRRRHACSEEGDKWSWAELD